MRKLVSVLILVPTLLAADDIADSRRLQREAQAAYKAKDFAQYLAKMKAASDLRPSHPTLLYNVASGLALNGRADESLAMLERIASMGMVYAPEKDNDFESIRSTPRFENVLAAFKKNATPFGDARSVNTMPEPALIAEGVAYDNASRRFFVSSVRNGSILAIDRNGKISTFVRDLPFGGFGMAIDEKRGVLWAASSAIEQNARFRAEDRGRAAVVEIDLRSGRVLRTIEGKGLFGDLTVASDGTLYVSEAQNIHRLRDGALEPFTTGGFVSLQGLAVTPRILYAADYSRGIAAVDLETRDVHFLDVPPDVSLLGVDGLYSAGNNVLIATQNGTNPQRIIRIRLAPGGMSVRGVDVLSSNQTNDITLGAIARGNFYFNGDAGWEAYDDQGKVKDPNALKTGALFRVSINSPK